MKNSICAHDECKKPFVKLAHNQKYCGDECCRRATNARLMQQYYERKARKAGTVRFCSNPDCKTKLSRYNEDTVCQSCQSGEKTSERNSLLAMVK